MGPATPAELAPPSGPLMLPVLPALWVSPLFPSPPRPYLAFPIGATTWQLPFVSLSKTLDRGTMMGP